MPATSRHLLGSMPGAANVNCATPWPFHPQLLYLQREPVVPAQAPRAMVQQRLGPLREQGRGLGQLLLPAGGHLITFCRREGWLPAADLQDALKVPIASELFWRIFCATLKDIPGWLSPSPAAMRWIWMNMPEWSAFVQPSLLRTATSIIGPWMPVAAESFV